MNILAIDFETADYGHDSACAIGLARIEDGHVVRSEGFLIRPPRREIMFSHIHGLTWADCESSPAFAALWPGLASWFDGIEMIAAHNAGFDRGILNGCCAAAEIVAPALPYLCTVRLARQAWDLRPTRLPDVCRHLVIALNHHDAASDARACAEIVCAALADGVALQGAVLQR